MIINDIGKDYEACIAARGYDSPTKAAQDLGLTRQALYSIIDGSHFIRASAIRTLEQLGYDIRIEFVRNLPDSEYVCAAEDEAKLHQVYSAKRDSERRSYTILHGIITMNGLQKHDSDMRSIFSGKKLISALGEDRSLMFPVAEFNSADKAEAEFKTMKKSCSTSCTVVSEPPRIYEVTFDALILVETLFDEEGNVIRRTEIKQYAAPAQTDEQRRKNAEYQKEYQSTYRKKK